MTASTATRIARNTAWFTFGSIGQKLLSFVHFTIIAMALGVGSTGRYFSVLAFTALFATAADWGISPVITREVAKDRTHGLALLRSALRCKAVTIVLTAISIAAATAIAGYPSEIVRAIAVGTIVVAMDSIHLLLYAVLRGIQRVHYEAIGTIVNQLTVTVAAIVLLTVIAGLRFGDATLFTATRSISTAWLLFPFVLASAVNLGIALYGLRREGLRPSRISNFKPEAHPPPAEKFQIPNGWRWLLRTSTPFALTAVLARVYTYSDTFLLSILAGELAVGYYSTPFKIAFAFQFLPLALIGALYPAMSEAAARDRTYLGSTFTAGVRSLILVALPIAFGIGILAPEILTIVYGPAFLPSAVPLSILAAAIPFTFVNFPAGYLLNAIDRQATNTMLIAIATASNIALNLILIPQYAAVGAAVSALTATILLAVLNFAVVHRFVRYDLRAFLAATVRTLLACFAMGAVVLVTTSLPLGARIPLGALTYGIVAFAVGAVRRSDCALILGIFRRRHAPLVISSAP